MFSRKWNKKGRHIVSTIPEDKNNIISFLIKILIKSKKNPNFSQPEKVLNQRNVSKKVLQKEKQQYRMTCLLIPI